MTEIAKGTKNAKVNAKMIYKWVILGQNKFWGHFGLKNFFGSFKAKKNFLGNIGPKIFFGQKNLLGHFGPKKFFESFWAGKICWVILGQKTILGHFGP